MNKKLAIITTHPIQYYAPLFKEMAKYCDLQVFYTWGNENLSKFDPDFGKEISWDIPLLEGYSYKFVENTSSDPSSKGYNGIVNPNLIYEIKTWNPQAILVFGWSYKSHLQAIRYFNGKLPVFFRGDSTLLDEKKSFNIILRRIFLKWVYSHVDKAFYVGIANKAYFNAHGMGENKLVLAPHAIDNIRFWDNDGKYKLESLAIRKSLHIDVSHVVILFAGKFESKKNPLMLLQAFSELNLQNMHLIFVGNGVLESELKHRAKNIPNVHFMPFQNQSAMPVVYRIADVFCLPSVGPGETWGLAVNEAMACGVAIIVSSKCGCAANLVDQRNGIVVDPQKIESLKSAILHYSDKSIAVKCGLESQTIIQDYTIPIAAKQICDNLM